MKKRVIIDNRMRRIEKEQLKKLGHELIEINTSAKVYSEISSHVDIFACKVRDKIIIEPTQYQNIMQSCIKSSIDIAENFIKGQDEVQEKYPDDIKYNVCTIGKKAIHNFQYTDAKLKQELINNNYELINTTQGYTNCSIAVIDDNSAIVSDKGLYKILKFHDIDTLLVENNLDIKLLNGENYSSKKGFIGGCITRLGDSIIVFGDLNKIDIDGRIRDFITSKKIKIIEFKGLDIIDYGGLIEN